MVVALVAENIKMTKFAEELKRRRLAAKMSLAELAEASNVSKTYIDNLEKDKPHPVTGALPQPSREKIAQIANALNWRLRDALELAYIQDFVDSSTTDDIPVDQFPEDVQRVVGLYGRNVQRMPPGPAREAYMKKLEATALSDWELLIARLEDEEGPEEPRGTKR